MLETLFSINNMKSELYCDRSVVVW